MERETTRVAVQADQGAVTGFADGALRAGRLIDMLERRGVISGYEGSKPRQVLITHADVPRILAGGSNADDGDGPPTGEVEPEPVSH